MRKNESITPPHFYTEEEIDSVRLNLENEIDNYINRYGKHSKLDTKLFLQQCMEYKFDIVLAMSQGHVESHFGTRGVATRTNSIFNVGAYDNGKIPKAYYYKNPNESIRPYLELMNTRYLVNGTTVTDLLQPRQFVNVNGKRYASAKNYERTIQLTYQRIKEETKIDSLYNVITSDEYISSIDYHKNKNKWI